MLKTVFHFVALTTAIAGVGATFVMGAANAATPTGSVPTCSRTVTDKCMDRPMMPTRHVAHHVEIGRAHV